MEVLKGMSRNKNVVHQARKTRRNGSVPGNIYAKNQVNLLFEISELELNKEISKNGDHGVLNLNIDGTEHNTLIKEVQRDPVNHKIIHIDLEELSKDKVITTEIPILFHGEANIAHQGGILQKEKNSVKVQCKGENIPKSIPIDVSQLQVGDVCRIMDLEVSNEISIMEDVNSVIAAVTIDNINVNSVESLTEAGSIISKG